MNRCQSSEITEENMVRAINHGIECMCEGSCSMPDMHNEEIFGDCEGCRMKEIAQGIDPAALVCAQKAEAEAKAKALFRQDVWMTCASARVCRSEADELVRADALEARRVCTVVNGSDVYRMEYRLK